MRVRPEYGFLFVAVAVLLAAVAFGAGRLTASTAAPRLAPISRLSSRADVEKHFDLGSGTGGLPDYTDTHCSGNTCAWEYIGDGKTWGAVLYLHTDAKAATGPPMTP